MACMEVEPGPRFREAGGLFKTRMITACVSCTIGLLFSNVNTFPDLNNQLGELIGMKAKPMVTQYDPSCKNLE